MWTIAVGEFHPTVAGIVTHSFVLLEIVQQQQSLANRGEGYFVQVTAKVLVNAVTVQVKFGQNHMMSGNPTNRELTIHHNGLD
jgi:hypothetical protein